MWDDNVIFAKVVSPVWKPRTALYARSQTHRVCVCFDRDLPWADSLSRPRSRKAPLPPPIHPSNRMNSHISLLALRTMRPGGSEWVSVRAKKINKFTHLLHILVTEFWMPRRKVFFFASQIIDSLICEGDTVLRVLNHKLFFLNKPIFQKSYDLVRFWVNSTFKRPSVKT